MTSAARTPEELERLFEDAFVLRDQSAVVPLFEEGAVLASRREPHEVRGAGAIARSASSLWERRFTYLGDPRRVLQARDVALVLAAQGVNVMRRSGDGSWRYAISLLDVDDPTRKGAR
jgi:hypothetical protein